MRVLGMFAFATIIVAGSSARADGLIHRLPPDGAWVLYAYQQRAELDHQMGGDKKVPDEVKRKMPRAGIVQGFLTLRSVGVAQVEGENCRWIELEQSVQIAGKTMAGTEAERAQRTIVLKVLVPEKRLAPGEDPFGHVLKMYFKDGDRNVEEIMDPQRRKYELDRFRPLFPAPGTDVKRTARQSLATASPTLGALECEQLTFASKYDGPLGGGQGRWTWEGEHRLWLNDRVPFGVACLELTVTSREATGPKESMVVTTKGIHRLVVAEVGTGARSRLPDAK